MSQGNQTTLKQFVIAGFPGLYPAYYDLVASLFFLVYVSTVAGNSLPVVPFVIECHLQKLMYIMMLSLAFSDIRFSTMTLSPPGTGFPSMSASSRSS
ncbi:hypothetical protein AAFF_G00127940 [Aldrovandia affinis]|uniref:Uncharacterized protein n=1 Tax=Aldrovandia affinis TaxID=143900 RepID=A0AAD7T1T4_9TELE|nr:hypothetical protein AAFF_G00127940 [Aldrovandia affinis]